jgi:peptidoglycan/LPS O-acetylase OafA/YrhL
VKHNFPTQIPALDGLRGVAIIAVLCSHLIWPSPSFDGIDRVLFNGWVGVDLFFVLSGFLITRILCETRDEPGYFRRFYVRRSLRIFPIYYLFLAILFLVVPLILRLSHEEMSTSLRDLIDRQGWYWSYLVNVLQASNHAAIDRQWSAHFWSLAVEEQFYLFWPAVVLLVPRRQLATLCVAIVLFALAGRIWIASGTNPFTAFVSMPTRLDALAAGAFVAALSKK